MILDEAGVSGATEIVGAIGAELHGVRPQQPGLDDENSGLPPADAGFVFADKQAASRD